MYDLRIHRIAKNIVNNQNLAQPTNPVGEVLAH